MTVDFKHTVEIARPAADVFAYIADAENNPKWQNGMVSCTWTSDEKLLKGATIAQEARFLGRAIVTTFVVTDYQPGRSISIESIVSTFPIQVTRSVESTGAGCVVTAHVRGQPSGLLKLFSGMVPKAVRKDYDALKVLLESA